MDFNGTNQFINLGISPVPNTTNFTMTAWVNIDTVAAGDSSHAIIHMGDQLTPFNGTRLYIKRGTDGGRIGAFDPDAVANNFTANIAITVDQWDLAAIRGFKSAVSGDTIGILGSWLSGLTHTAEAGTNRLLIFCASNESTTDNQNLTAVTYGTESLTLIGVVEVDDATNGRVEMWRLNEAGIAAASSSTFVPTWVSGPGEVIYAHAFFENVDQTTPTGNTSSNTKIGGDASITLLGSWLSGTTHTEEGSDGTDRLFVVFPAHNDATEGVSMTSMTYGGQAMTSVAASVVEITTGNVNHIELWYLNDVGIAASTSSTIAPTWSDTAQREILSHAFFLDVDQSTPIGTVEVNTNVVSDVLRVGSWTDAVFVDADQNPITGTIAEAGTDNTNRVFVVICAAEYAATHATDPTCTAVTWGGQSMTLVLSNDVIVSGGARDGHFSVFILDEVGIQAASTTTISCTWAGTIDDNRREAVGGFFINVDQVTPLFADTAEADGTVALLSFASVTTGAGNMHVISSQMNTGNLAYSTSSLSGLSNFDLTSILTLNSQTVGIATGTSDGTSTAQTITSGTTTRHGGVAFTLSQSTTTITTKVSIASTSGDMIIAAASTGVNNAWTPNNGFTEGVDSNSGTHTVAAIYKLSTGSVETPSMTNTSMNRASMAAAQLNASSTGAGTIATSGSIANDNNEMVVAVAMCGDSAAAAFTPNNSFIEGIETASASSSIVAIYKATTGAAETPSVTHTGPDRMAIFGAELNQTSITGIIDVSVNGGVWTNLITGNTSGWVTSSANHHSMGHTFSSGSFSNWTDGSIADVRYYNRQLNDAEIATIHAAKGKDAIIDGLLTRWPLRNGSIGSIPAAPTVTFVDSHTVTTVAGNTIDVDVKTDLATEFQDFIIIAVGDGNVSGGGTATTVSTTSEWQLLNSGQTALPATVSTPSISLFCKFSLANADETSYTFTSSTGGAHNMVAVACAYRNCPINTGNTSTITTGTSTTATSPANAMIATALVLSIACADDGGNGDFVAAGSQTIRAQAKVTNTDPNGCQVVIGDVIGATSSPAQTWTIANDQWGGLTVNVFSNKVVDHAGADNHPHNIAAVGNGTYIETDLR